MRIHIELWKLSVIMGRNIQKQFINFTWRFNVKNKSNVFLRVLSYHSTENPTRNVKPRRLEWRAKRFSDQIQRIWYISAPQKRRKHLDFMRGFYHTLPELCIQKFIECHLRLNYLWSFLWFCVKTMYTQIVF